MRGIVGRMDVNRSLGTPCYHLARRLVRKVAYDVELEFDALRENPSAASFVSRMPTRMPQAARTLFSSPTLRTVCEQYLGDPTRTRTTKSIAAYQASYDLILEILGADVQVASLTREQCRDLLGVLQRLPPHAKKRKHCARGKRASRST